jgi:hypothetical protein
MYQLKEVVLKNDKLAKKVLVIEFIDPAMAVVGEFLMADGGLIGAVVLQEIEKVLAGEKSVAEISGNRCGLTIHEETTLVNDLLAGMYHDLEGLAPYEINTENLKDLIHMWLVKREAFYHKH